jgi:hypothetical protein
MSIPLINGEQVGNDGYLVQKGISNPRLIIYPRTIGGIIEESGLVEMNFMLKCYLVVPSNTTRDQLETFFNTLNEKWVNQSVTLTANGNVYQNVYIKSIDYDLIIVNNYTHFTIHCILGDQNSGTDIPNQLGCNLLQSFSRGRILKFTTIWDDSSQHVFQFWHNFDTVRNFETQINLKSSTIFGGNTKVIVAGGFEKLVCQGWIIGPDTKTRQTLEAYFYNMINGPLGHIGVMQLGTQVWQRCFLQEISVEDSTNPTLKYTLTFLTSLQC